MGMRMNLKHEEIIKRNCIHITQLFIIVVSFFLKHDSCQAFLIDTIKFHKPRINVNSFHPNSFRINPPGDTIKYHKSFKIEDKLYMLSNNDSCKYNRQNFHHDENTNNLQSRSQMIQSILQRLFQTTFFTTLPTMNSFIFSNSASAATIPSITSHKNENNSADDFVILTNGAKLFSISDPNSYSALVYIPSESTPSSTTVIQNKLPVLLVLHGAAKNELPIWNLANSEGEHSFLPLGVLASSFLSTNDSMSSREVIAPSLLSEGFVVVTPYSYGKRSFYEEPRSKILQFVNYITSFSSSSSNVLNDTTDTNSSQTRALLKRIDPTRIFLFGFSDGATLGIELLTTQKFKAGVFCSYGFTGVLPKLALERLANLPIWIFHAVDDEIFPVSCSDRLVNSLQSVNDEMKKKEIVRYSKLEKGGHVMPAVVASRSSEVFEWLSSL